VEQPYQPKTHEEFMREVTKRQLEAMIDIHETLKDIKVWVTLSGIIVLISLVFLIINGLLSFGNVFM